MEPVKEVSIEISNGRSFREVLPIAASPWFSIGDHWTMQRVGEVLDALPTNTGAPSWEAAQKIGAIFQEYVKEGGDYSKEYETCPTGHYAPGEWEITPIFYGTYCRWGLKILMKATCGRTLQVLLGIRGAGYDARQILLDFNGPSMSSATQIREGLMAAKVPYYEKGDRELTLDESDPDR